MITIPELHGLLARATHDHELGERVLEVLDWADERLAVLARAGVTVGQAVDLARYGHDKYLRACAAYLRSPCEGNLIRFRQCCGRLGGTSKAMYARQRRTFDSVLKLLGLEAVLPPIVANHLWQLVLCLERRGLARVRAAKVGRRG